MILSLTHAKRVQSNQMCHKRRHLASSVYHVYTRGKRKYAPLSDPNSRYEFFSPAQLSTQFRQTALVSPARPQRSLFKLAVNILTPIFYF